MGESWSRWWGTGTCTPRSYPFCAYPPTARRRGPGLFVQYSVPHRARLRGMSCFPLPRVTVSDSPPRALCQAPAGAGGIRPLPRSTRQQQPSHATELNMEVLPSALVATECVAHIALAFALGTPGGVGGCMATSVPHGWCR